MTGDEKIATALLLGGEFTNAFPSLGWLCLRPGDNPYPTADKYALTKGMAAERFLGTLGYWIDDAGEIRDCNP